MNITEYRNLRVIIFGLASFIALIVGEKFFLLSIVLFALPYIYSTPPLRLRRFVGISNIIIALHAVFLAIFGIYIFYPDPQFREFPRLILLAIFIGVTLVSSVKDIKDREADRKLGIKTLPSVLGDKKSRLIIAASFCVSYFLAPWVMADLNLMLLAAIFGVLTVIVILARKLNEKMTFALLACYLIIIFWTHYL
jgi:4-hydroxybenzoate polyprenyltransferase